MSGGYLAVVAAVSVFAGVVAAVAGFGIGSLLTPLIALQLDARLSVAAASIPHVIGTAQRLWLMRRHVDRALLREFGIASAAGGLAGALLHGRLSNDALTIVFGVLLLVTAAAELTGWMRRVRWGRSAGPIAGAVSGLFGGLVGNQGSVRTAGLLAYRVSPAAFVATATAVALIVDGVRVPFYLAAHGAALRGLVPMIAVASGGVVVGTFFGARVVSGLSERRFRIAVAILLAALGILMLASARSARSALT